MAFIEVDMKYTDLVSVLISIPNIRASYKNYDLSGIQKPDHTNLSSTLILLRPQLRSIAHMHLKKARLKKLIINLK